MLLCCSSDENTHHMLLSHPCQMVLWCVFAFTLIHFLLSPTYLCFPLPPCCLAGVGQWRHVETREEVPA